MVLVHFAVPAEVGDDTEVAATALDFAAECYMELVWADSTIMGHGSWKKRTLFASVAVHVRLQRTGPGEALVADLALVLLLRRARHLGAELAHHGLRRWRHLAGRGDKALGPRHGQSPRGDGVHVRAAGRVLADAGVDGAAAVEAVEAGAGDAGAARGEAVGVA